MVTGTWAPAGCLICVILSERFSVEVYPKFENHCGPRCFQKSIEACGEIGLALCLLFVSPALSTTFFPV